MRKTYQGEKVLKETPDFIFTDAKHRDVNAFFRSEKGVWFFDSTYADLKDAIEGVQVSKERHDRMNR